MTSIRRIILKNRLSTKMERIFDKRRTKNILTDIFQESGITEIIYDYIEDLTKYNEYLKIVKDFNYSWDMLTFHAIKNRFKPDFFHYFREDIKWNLISLYLINDKDYQYTEELLEEFKDYIRQDLYSTNGKISNS